MLFGPVLSLNASKWLGSSSTEKRLRCNRDIKVRFLGGRLNFGSPAIHRKPNRFTGQVVRNGRRIVYAWLLAMNEGLNSNKWQTASLFAI